MQQTSIYNSKLKGISSFTLNSNGLIKECLLSEYNPVETEYGILIPQYDNSDVRRKYTNSISFYESGAIKSICLHEQTPIVTSAGTFPAELVTFYESGKIKRIFPLNGKISGYWSEEDEYKLAEDFFFNLDIGNLKTKVISIHFYEESFIKSLTLWPQEILEIASSAGTISTRTGISFYRDGKIKSLEPAQPTLVKTPIGKISAFNTAAIGITGDNNSLSFDEKGQIKSIVTSTDIITVRHGWEVNVYGPGYRPSMLDLTKNEVVPLNIHFEEGTVSFSNDDLKYNVNDYEFSIKHVPQFLNIKCGNCDSCTLCG